MARKRFICYILIAALMLLTTTPFEVRAQEQEGVLNQLKFKNADIKVVLQAITQKAVKDGQKVNIIIAPEVEGSVTIDLENVGWQTALDAVLRLHDYSYEWVGENIILVDSLEKLIARRSREQTSEAEGKLVTEVVTLNFAKVAEAQASVNNMLSSRGRLTVDSRTNTIIITDSRSNVEQIKKAVNRLDKITPQVLIEAKVIETNLNDSLDLGINWNISASASAAQRPIIWPFTKNSDEDDDFTPTSFPDATDSDFSFGTLNASSLSAALDVIYNDSSTKILSTPQLTTVDNNTATIDVLTRTPVPNYSYNSDTGAWEISGFEYINYGVMLEVTPQINEKGFITLTVKPEVSEKVQDITFSSSGSGSTAQIPELNTQTTETKVMVKSGETLVIGGLIKEKEVERVDKIPILGDIPLLGYFFKHKSTENVKKNLMIFITPTIVTPQLDEEKKTEQVEQT
jgi:type IV pilus secretin PilQ/predicted competence protein